MASFDSIAASLAPHKRLALILLEIKGDRRGLEVALSIVRKEADGPWEYERLTEAPPTVVLLKLNPRQARRVEIALAENGFTTLMTVYPQGKAL